MKKTLIATTIFAMTSAVPAFAHYHITTGANGARLAFAAYGTTDAGSSVHYDATTGYLQDSSNAPVVLPISSFAPSGVGGAGPGAPFTTSPTIYGSAFTLTTDYYTSSESPAFATSGSGYDSSLDPLVGSGNAFPDIVYKFVSLTALNGASTANQIAYNVPVNTTGEPQHQVAYAAVGGTTSNNLLDYGYGNHIHGVTLYSLQPGLYALGLVAHDNTGRFADSTPAYFEINAVPEPASIAWLGFVSLLLIKRSKR